VNKDLYRRVAKDNGVRYPATLGREALAHERAVLESDNALIDEIDGQLRWGGRTVALDDERQVMTLRMILAGVKHGHLVKIASIDADERMRYPKPNCICLSTESCEICDPEAFK